MAKDQLLVLIVDARANFGQRTEIKRCIFDSRNLSRWNEPFGVVALEGIACGCVVVGSSGGGLPEAIGPCGVTFPNGDVRALAEALMKCVGNECPYVQYSVITAAHLRHHEASTVAQAYIHVFTGAV